MGGTTVNHRLDKKKKGENPVVPLSFDSSWTAATVEFVLKPPAYPQSHRAHRTKRKAAAAFLQDGGRI